VHFDGTITAGSLISGAIVLAVGLAGWVAFRARVDTILKSQADLTEALTSRFEKHEERDSEMFQGIQARLIDLVSGVQRLVGQNDVFRKTEERRKT
jgi:hypothetical protein